jgi:hypothetical protein
MAPIHNDEREEMLEVREDEMWNLNNGFWITENIR